MRVRLLVDVPLGLHRGLLKGRVMTGLRHNSSMGKPAVWVIGDDNEAAMLLEVEYEILDGETLEVPVAQWN